MGFVTELPRIFGGKPMRRDKVIDVVASEVRFTPLDDGNLEYMIDGDLYDEGGELVLKTGPKLRFIRLTGNAVGESPLPEPPAQDLGASRGA
jgi:hypothetical protein